MKSIIFATLFAVLIHTPAAYGASILRSSRRLDEEGPVSKRECEIKADDSDEVEFECKAKTEDSDSGEETKDKIEFKVSSDKSRGLKVKVEYEQEVETDDVETESETQYDIYFTKLIEYQKSSLSSIDEAYDWESDVVVKETILTDLGSFTDVVTENDISTFSISTVDSVASFMFTISQGGESESITANKMKIDFELKGYDWAQNDTYVALISSVESKRKVEVEYEDDDSDDSEDESASAPRSQISEDVIISFADAIDTTGIVPFGEYTWAKDAVVMDVNGTAPDVTIAVVATSPPAAASSTGDDGSVSQEQSVTNEEMIAFSFVGSAAQSAQDIYWDPEAGIGYASSSSLWSVSAAALLSGGAAMLMAHLL